MGTNYYINTVNPSGVVLGQVHIGKISYGWNFEFQGSIYKTVAEWFEKLKSLNADEIVVDEYDYKFSGQQMIDKINAVKDGHTMWSYAIEDFIRCKLQRKYSSQYTMIMNEYRRGADWIDNGYNFSNGELC